jgi:hypothetical protein
MLLHVIRNLLNMDFERFGLGVKGLGSVFESRLLTIEIIPTLIFFISVSSSGGITVMGGIKSERKK